MGVSSRLSVSPDSPPPACSAEGIRQGRQASEGTVGGSGGGGKGHLAGNDRDRTMASDCCGCYACGAVRAGNALRLGRAYGAVAWSSLAAKHRAPDASDARLQVFAQEQGIASSSRS